jgi:hypothetical protein
VASSCSALDDGLLRRGTLPARFMQLLEKAQQFLKTSVNLMEIPNGNTFKS